MNIFIWFVLKKISLASTMCALNSNNNKITYISKHIIAKKYIEYKFYNHSSGWNFLLFLLL